MRRQYTSDTRDGGRREHAGHDTRRDDAGDDGHPDTCGDQFNQIVSVTIDGRKIEVGQSLRFQLFWGLAVLGCLMIMLFRMIRHGPREVIQEVMDQP